MKAKCGNASIRCFILCALAVVSGCSTPDLDPFGGGGGIESIPKWKYRGDLHAVMDDATRFRLSVGSPGRVFGPPLVDTIDPSLLADMKKHIAFKKNNPMATCACPGGYTFEWFRGDELLAQVTLHVGRSEMHMRWERWEGDAWLTPDSERWLACYMVFKIEGFIEKLNGVSRIPFQTR